MSVPPGQRLELAPPQPWEPTTSYEVAAAYAVQVWNETFYRQIMLVLPKLYKFILKLLEKKAKEGGRVFPAEALREWILQVKADELRLNADFLTSSVARQLAKAAYTKSREDRFLHVWVPYFAIDPTGPDSRLEMQKYFDVGREAVLMSSSSDIQQQEAPVPEGRRFYNTMPAFPEQYSVAQELQKLHINAEKMLSERPWVPKELADYAGVRINGRFETRNHWELFQSLLRYQKIEEVFSSQWRELNPPAINPPATKRTF